MHDDPDLPFPALRAFLDAYFHQDFDLDGDVGDVMTRYRAEAPEAERQRLRREIACFLRRHQRDADDAFAHVLGACVDPAGWGMSAAAWLRWIARLG